ncbi:hypothetical protein [Thermocatellispora tengchongensis]|uniref:hypothetical protein n=1 Tax=Thermocatellispora tengchongensis TaxID=1073253 RepID=UPI003624D41B
MRRLRASSAEDSAALRSARSVSAACSSPVRSSPEPRASGAASGSRAMVRPSTLHAIDPRTSGARSRSRRICACTSARTSSVVPT